VAFSNSGAEGPRPRVSAIIVTTGRATLRDAVTSVLRQDRDDVEVIVVVDGDGEALDEVRAVVEDPRVRFEATGRRSNANRARNMGVRIARGEYVAFLDDDDIWAQDKTSQQLALVDRSNAGVGRFLATSSVMTIGAKPGRIWPSRGPIAGEDISEYLFKRRTLRPRPHLLQTSTWLAPRRVFEAIPFDESLRIHQDWDWLLRAASSPDFEIIHHDSPLVKYRVGSFASVSSDASRSEASLQWACYPPTPLSARVHGDLILMCGIPMALRNDSPDAVKRVRRLANKHGRPSARARAVAEIKVLRWSFGRLTRGAKSGR
jgi:glycosyltransferase involved in cell wall biosynthesis